MNLVQQHQSEEKLWAAARMAKMNQKLDLCYSNLFSSSFDQSLDGEKSQLLIRTMESLGVTNISVEMKSSDISDETLELAARIYIYLGNCPVKHWHNWDVWRKFYVDILTNTNIKHFLLTLSRILTVSKEKGKMEFEMSKRLFLKLSARNGI